MLEKTTNLIPKEIAGIRIPDSQLAVAATQLVQEFSPPYLFNHVVRTYIFAELLAKNSNTRYDSELLYLGSMFHDLGLTEKFNGNERFEVDGADAASNFLSQHNFPPEKITLVWDAIALHTSIGIVSRKQIEIAYVSLGAGVDVAGFGLDQISQEDLKVILKTFPRLGLKKAITNTFATIYQKKPLKALFSLAADIVRKEFHGVHLPDIYELIEAAPFEE
ncbi:MAG: HD domain-containing protein [Acidobacteriota bacterium]